MVLRINLNQFRIGDWSDGASPQVRPSARDPVVPISDIMSSTPYYPVVYRGCPTLIDRGRCAVPHQRGASHRSLGTRRSCRVGPGRLRRPVRQARGCSRRRFQLRDESWRHGPTWMLVQPATSTGAVDLTGLLRRSGNRTARDRDSRAGHATERPHHARNVSMSRSTCMASARSDSSSASLSASARIAAPAFRRAASIRADRTATDTAVPSLVKTSSAFDVSSSGLNVIVSAIATVYDVL